MYKSARDSSGKDTKNGRFKPTIQMKGSIDELPPSALLYDEPRDEYVAIF